MSTPNEFQLIKQALANSYVLLVKTQSVHWNVVGQDFYPIHLLTETQYNELFTAVDVIAEHLRSCGDMAPGSMKEFLALSSLSEGTGGSSMQDMCKELMSAHEKMVAFFDSAMKGGLTKGTEDLFIDRKRAHEKAAWMWRSSAGNPGTSISPSAALSQTKSIVSKATGGKKKAKKKVAKPSVKAKSKAAPAKAKPATKPAVSKAAPVKAKSVVAKPQPVKKVATSGARKGRLSRNLTGLG